MKKCPGCKKEIDKYGIACQYCGKISKAGYDNALGTGPSTGQDIKESEQSEDRG